MLSAVVPYTGNTPSFLETIKSFLMQSFTTDLKRLTQLPQLIIVNRTTENVNTAETQVVLRRFRSLITIVDCPELTLPAAFNRAVKLAARSYITFALPGDVFAEGSLAEACALFKAQDKAVSFISLNTHCLFRDSEKYEPTFKNNAPSLIDLNKYPELVPIVFSGIILKTACFKTHRFNEVLEYDFGLDFIYRLLKPRPTFGLAKAAAFKTTNSLESNEVGLTFALKKAWYWQTTKDFLIPLFDSYTRNKEALPKHLKFAALYQLKWRFQHNINISTKHVIDDQAEAFFELCSHLLKRIEVPLITNKQKFFTLTQLIKYTFLHLKYGNQYSPNYFYHEGNTFLEQGKEFLFKANSQKIILELLEFDEENLIIEASIDNFIDMDKCKLLIFYAKEPVEIQETYRYAHTKYFSVSVHKRYTFKAVIPKHRLRSSPGAIAFKLKVGGHLIDLSIITRRYTSKLSSNLPKTYWASSGFFLRLATNKKTISVKAASLTAHIKAELTLLRSMLFSKNCPIQLFTLRCLYWLSYPFFSRKRIWLTYDKLYKAGDCGEYFYKYAATREDGITAAYVLNETAPDYTRLHSEGHRPLKYGTLKHKLYFLHAEVIFNTHAGVHTFHSFSGSDVIYFQNLLRADIACIQHGLSVQQLAFNANRIFNNTKRYYCASKYEIKNLSRPVYGYEDASILKLTGIPRYDGLKSNDKRQILITPTWRSYIAMPPALKKEARPYSQNFKDTDYFKIYNSLLSDPRLIETARATGYKIIYLLHPVISAQVIDYPQRNGVEIISSLDINYEEILCESSLMVTDYSGVQFDFAYMRKPVVYYHPAKLPAHYKDGGFLYDTMSFGEICTEHDELVNSICNYMLNNCEVQPYYLARQNDFFAHTDLNSSKRIYDDMLAYQAMKKAPVPSLLSAPAADDAQN